MKYNPFRPGNIVRPGMFAGRYEEIETIEKSLFQTKHGNPQHLILTGERGIGKSSLMMFANYVASGEIKLNLQEDLNFLVINIELQSGLSATDVVKLLGKKFKSELNLKEELRAKATAVWDFIKDWEVLGVKYNAKDSATDPITLVDELVDQFIKFIKEAEGIDGIAILIDEADKADQKTQLGQILKLLTEKITRSDCNQILVALAGLPDLLTKLKESHESSISIFQVLNLEPLLEAERVQVIEKALEEANEKNTTPTKIDDNAKILIADLSEGYPHFVQQFGYSAFESDTNNIIDPQDVLNGTFRENGALDQLGHKYFQEHFFDKVNSDDYRKVLIFMADFHDKWVSRADIIKGLEGILSKTTVDNALKALKRENIILPNSSNRGEYKLPTKSFATWIKVKNKQETEKIEVSEPSK
jgi:Cdc6-like AAA superfamily ATPase